MVGRVGFEPTVSFRRRIMSPLPATSTASGPEKQEKKRPGAWAGPGAGFYLKVGASPLGKSPASLQNQLPSRKLLSLSERLGWRSLRSAFASI